MERLTFEMQALEVGVTKWDTELHHHQERIETLKREGTNLQAANASNVVVAD